MKLKQLHRLIQISKDHLEKESFHQRLLEHSIEQLMEHSQEMDKELAQTQQGEVGSSALAPVSYADYPTFIACKNAIDLELEARKKDAIIVREKIRELYAEINRFADLINNHALVTEAKELEEANQEDVGEMIPYKVANG